MGEVWEDDGTYRFDRTADPRRDLLDRHAAADGAGSLHVGHVFSYTHTDTIARYQRMRGKRSSTRWAGTTTACPPSGGCRTSSASLRSVAAVRPELRAARQDRRKPPPVPISRPQLPRALRARSTIETSRCSRAVATARPVGRLVADLRHDRRAQPAIAQLAFLRNIARGKAYTPRRPPCGTSTSRPPSPKPSWKTATARLPTTASRSAPRRRHGATSSSTPPGPSCSRPASALVAHPDDARYQPLFGTTVSTPLFGVEVPIVAHELAEPEKGTGHRDDLHVRRHHRRHLVARARPADPRDHRAQRANPRDAPDGVRRRRSGYRPAGRQDGERRRSATRSSNSSRRVGRARSASPGRSAIR